MLARTASRLSEDSLSVANNLWTDSPRVIALKKFDRIRKRSDTLENRLRLIRGEILLFGVYVILLT